MRFFLISDNTDTQMGMSLAGIDGVVVNTSDEAKAELEKAMSDSSVAIVLITNKLVNMCRDTVYEKKMSCSQPLIVEIPDRHGTTDISEAINSYVRDAIGLRL